MSIITSAEKEMRLAQFDEEDIQTFLGILHTFFDRWDSGGAVHWAAPVLQRLIAGKCLTPLSGDASEWFDHGDGVLQNIRVSSVFKDPRFHDGLLAYDLDNPAGPHAAIEFPYFPRRAEVASPLIEIDTGKE